MGWGVGWWDDGVDGEAAERARRRVFGVPLMLPGALPPLDAAHSSVRRVGIFFLFLFFVEPLGIFSEPRPAVYVDEHLYNIQCSEIYLH